MYWLAIFFTMLAFPTAYLLAAMTKDELKKRKPFFIAFAIIFLISAITSILIHFAQWKIVFFTSFFMTIVELLLLKLSSQSA
jgi:hypothetical protein